MPYVANNGVRIHYQVVGSGPPLVLQHGSFGSADDWKEFGYVDALAPQNQLVLVDARGHGLSDKPHEAAAYDLKLRVSDITAVLDDLQIPKSDYMGYSMGGWIGFGLAKYAPQRVRSLILGGAHPYAENMEAFRGLLPQEPMAFIAMIEQVYGQYMTPGVRARHLTNDLSALLASTQNRTSLAEGLSGVSVPFLLFVGEDDPRLPNAQKCCGQLPNVTLFSLPHCNHVAAFARSDLFLPQVIEFLGRS
jgi:pimeloyl-ACP methyl ester carboxylesterase